MAMFLNPYVFGSPIQEVIAPKSIVLKAFHNLSFKVVSLQGLKGMSDKFMWSMVEEMLKFWEN
jgi:hypothetical protein